MNSEGKKVSFQHPDGEKHERGISQDRFIVVSNPSAAGVPYWDVVDLIRFAGDLPALRTCFNR